VIAVKIVEETPYRFRIEREGAMRVPGIVFASRSLLPDEHGDMATHDQRLDDPTSLVPPVAWPW